jgi:hypothetical protein
MVNVACATTDFNASVSAIATESEAAVVDRFYDCY